MPQDDVALAQEAYLWGWALVNAAKRADRAKLLTNGGRDVLHVQGAPVGYGQIVMLIGFVGTTERIICCPSRDILYGSGAFHLAGTPGMVIQVPDFANRYWLYSLYDARTNEVCRIGLQYNTKPGFYLLVGPDWSGQTPAGIDDVWNCPTDLAFVIPRIYTDGTTKDLQAVLPLIQQICSYDLTAFTPNTWQTRHWENNFRDDNPIVLQGRGEEARYVKPELFIAELRNVLDTVPALPGEESRYDNFRDLLRRALLDPLIRLKLNLTFKKTEAGTIAPLMQWKENGVHVGNGWYTSVNAAEWGVDEYLARTATAKSNMFENRAEETKYYYTDTDSSGDLLFGSNQYAITFPQDQLLKYHIKGFWSITVYDEFHFFNTVTNPQDIYSRGTKDETSFVYENDGSLKLYAGLTPPQQGIENWLPTPDGEQFSLYIRAYWPDNVILNGQ